MSADPSDSNVSRADAASFGSEPGKIAHYRLVRILGRGGQGVVYLAEDERLGRKVALKVLTGFGLASPDVVLRFRREAELASKLDHPGICRVYDAGFADAVPYIAMQYVEGTTLADRIASAKSAYSTGLTNMEITFSGGTEAGSTTDARAGEAAEDPTTVASAAAATPDRRGVEDLLRVFEKAALALHAAHETGIVHRDIKPGNIMVTRSGDPILLDFGIARADDADQLALTRTGDLFGTPAYMPPEQVSGRGARLDRRADVYALGVTMFECLTLRRPFDAPTREGLFQAVLRQDPPDARKLNPAVTPDVRVVLETALEKDPARRYATTEALASDLAAAREGRPIQARPVGLAGRTIRWAKREPAKATLLVVLLAALPTIATLVTARVKDLPQLEAARRAARDVEVDALLSAASFELTEGDGARAVARFREALVADPSSREAMGGLVFALIKIEDVQAASAEFDRYEASLGTGSAWHEIKSTVATALGRKEEFQRLHGEAPPPRTAYEHFLRSLRDLVKGERGDREALRRSLRHADAALHLSNLPRLSLHTLRVHIAAHLGERQIVEDAVVALKHHWGSSADAVYWCGFAQAAFDDPVLLRAGAEDLRQAVALNPNECRSRTLLGVTLGKLGRLDEAAESLREAIRIDPSNVYARYNLAACYRLQRRPEEELGTLQEALRALPENGELLYALGLAHVRAERVDEAAAAFRRAVAATPGSADARYELAVQLEKQGLLDEALRELREAQRLRPEHAETHCNLCGVLQEQHLYAEALVAVRRGHELGQKKAGWRFPSGQWVKEAEAAAAAETEREATVRTAIANDDPPEEPEILVGAARVALRLGHAKEAVAWYRAAFEEMPEIADAIEYGHRRIAARAAAVAAAAPDFYDAARASLRGQALTWLEEEFARLKAYLRDEGPTPRAVRIGLAPPLSAPEFAPFRDPAALEALPAAERARWTAYWAASVAALAELEPRTSQL